MSRARSAVLLLSSVLLAANLAGCDNKSRDQAKLDPGLTTPSSSSFDSPTEAQSPESMTPAPGDPTTTSSEPTIYPTTPGPITSHSTSRTPTTGPTSTHTQGPTGKPPTGPPPRNPCGTPPTGRSPDGKLRQRIVFQPPGNHQWPDNTLKLRGCSTSGLRVAYEFSENGHGPNCHVEDPAAATVQGQGYNITCRITATQPGNGTYAAATPITHTWMVGPLAMTAAFVGTSDELRYDADSPTITLHARVSAIHAIPKLTAGVGISGSASMSCIDPSFRTTIGGNGDNDIRFDVPVKLTDPTTGSGNCDLYLSVQVDQTVSGGQHSRHFTVAKTR
ncbi:hypothetical protein [Kribbella speibonae]|uniref:hypothetical protein n=1 Tax=Kribbella speibonae TaxID=1572660 RepID=UPI0013F3B28A|nr:hypothetical protein [Kribbella speibonae]